MYLTPSFMHEKITVQLQHSKKSVVWGAIQFASAFSEKRKLLENLLPDTEGVDGPCQVLGNLDVKVLTLNHFHQSPINEYWNNGGFRPPKVNDEILDSPCTEAEIVL